MENGNPCAHLLAIIDAQNEIVASELGLDEAMGFVAERARILTGADAAVIELVEDDEMVCACAAGTAAPHLGTRMPRDTSLSGICIELNRVLRSDYTSSADRRLDPEPWAEGHAGSVVCVPLRDADGPIGTLKAYATAPHTFATDDEQTLELLAGLVAAHLSQPSRAVVDVADERRDPVTDLPNLRAYDERLALEAERARRYRYPLALVLLELDGLAAVIEELGERAGDDVVREVAEVMSGSRFADEAFRIGDNEFAILLPHTDLAGAEAAAARIVMQISAGGVVSASWGAASGEDHPAALQERADRALLAAKGEGRYASAG